jgi:NADPH-dependent ferric siderophore reductase
VWGGGHSPAMTKIRRHVRAQRTFARGAVQVLGYW